LSAPCAGCHGTAGASAGQAPVIGGLSKTYLKASMVNYKNDSRYSTVMSRVAKGYSDEQIDAIADYFAQQPWVNGEQEIDAALAAKGKGLHSSKGCVGCHGANGISATPTVPRLAGQYADYLVYQMRDYANADLAIPASAMPMRGILQGLSDQELEALAHFYASQQ
jgi:sulfide dehydrogenase cytochrome subunit